MDKMNDIYTVRPVNTQLVFESMKVACEKAKPWDVVAKIFAYIGYCLTVVLPLADGIIATINYFKNKVSYSEPQLIQTPQVQTPQVQTPQTGAQLRDQVTRVIGKRLSVWAPKGKALLVQMLGIYTTPCVAPFTVHVENAQSGLVIGHIEIPLERDCSPKDYLVRALLANNPSNVPLPINFYFYDINGKPLKDRELSIKDTPGENLNLSAMRDIGIRTVKKDAFAPNLFEEVLVYADGCKSKVKINLSKLNPMKKATVPIGTVLPVDSVEDFLGNHVNNIRFYAKVIASTDLDVQFQVGYYRFENTTFSIPARVESRFGFGAVSCGRVKISCTSSLKEDTFVTQVVRYSDGTIMDVSNPSGGVHNYFEVVYDEDTRQCVIIHKQ